MAEGRHAELLSQMKAECGGRDRPPGTACWVDNATGKAIDFVIPHDWAGKLCYPNKYPETIQFHDGFFHEAESAMGPGLTSAAAVVYRAKNWRGTEYDVLCSWYFQVKTSPPADVKAVKAFTVIKAPGYFQNDDQWKEVWGSLPNAGHTSQAEKDGIVSDVSIEEVDEHSTTPTVFFEATVTAAHA